MWYRRTFLVFLVGLLCFSPRIVGFTGYETRLAPPLPMSAQLRMDQWLHIVQSHQLHNQPPQDRDAGVQAINRFFNHLLWVSDHDNWQQEDYWATPTEMLVHNSGDSEDYVIAKYVSLLALGIPDEQLRISYVVDERQQRSHMVLTYYPQPAADPWVMDNLHSELLPASARSELRFVYSLRGADLWLAAREKSTGQAAMPIAALVAPLLQSGAQRDKALALD